MRRRPTSVVAERAVRYLRDSGKPETSVRLAREILALVVADEASATTVLGGAFGEDPRLQYADDGWILVPVVETAPEPEPADEPEIAFILVEGERPAARAPLRLTGIAAARRRGDTIVAACGGELKLWPPGAAMRAEMLEVIDRARPVVHAPPGGLGALDLWLADPLDRPLSLRMLARRRAGVPISTTIEGLAEALGLAVRVGDDVAQRVEILPACFDALRQEGEGWDELLAACTPSRRALPWERYAFTADDLRAVPSVPGTYRFYDLDDKLLYVGKSSNLKRRLAAWFREDSARSARSASLVDAVHRYEIAPSGSELAALIREATQIRKDRPERNVQRNVHAEPARAARLDSILILEPAEAPSILRAWLIRRGRLLDTVSLGPRGGGIKRIERVLERGFFDPQPGPVSRRPKEVDVEIVARWLSEHRDRVVAFDPTHLRSSAEVVARLQWFLDRGALVDPEGSPILPR